MNRVLFLSDKSTDQVKQQLAFMYGYRPENVVSVNHVRGAQQEIDENTLVHINQPPLTMASLVPCEQFLEVMARPPYNLHNPWLNQFDRILVTFYDVSRQDRFIEAVK